MAVGHTGGVEVVVFLGELAAQLHDLLFEFGVAAAEILDVVGAAESGLTPCLFAEGLGESVAQLGVFSHESVDAVECACKISDQRGAADRGSCGRRGGWFGGLGYDQGVQVRAPIEKGAIDSRPAGDTRDADLVAGPAGAPWLLLPTVWSSTTIESADKPLRSRD